MVSQQSGKTAYVNICTLPFFSPLLMRKIKPLKKGIKRQNITFKTNFRLGKVKFYNTYGDLPMYQPASYTFSLSFIENYMAHDLAHVINETRKADT